MCICYVNNNVSCVKAEQFGVDVNLYPRLARLEPGPRYLLIWRVIVDSFRHLLEICHNRHLPKIITFSPFRIIFPINVMSAFETTCLNNLQSVSCPYGGNFLTFVFLVVCTPRCMKWAYWSCFDIELVSGRSTTAGTLLTYGCSACLWKVYSYLADQEISVASWFLTSAVLFRETRYWICSEAVRSRPSSLISFFKVAFQYQPRQSSSGSNI